MNNTLRILLPALALFARDAFAAEPDPMGQLDQAMKTVVAFEYGKDAGPLRKVEEIVFDAAGDPGRRAGVEGRLLQDLASSAVTRDAKEFICRQLLTLGTERCVPALEPLLADPALSHMARFALGRLESPKASEALARAIERTSGNLQAGIVNTLGDRRYVEALPRLARLLESQESEVSRAAADALGKIGGREAVKALEAARFKAAPAAALAIDNALLGCADRYASEGNDSEAESLYASFSAPDRSKALRMAALRGLAGVSGRTAAPLLAEAIRGADADLRAFAIGLARTARGSNVTRTLADLLPALAPEAQPLLLGALGARGDKVAIPAIQAAMKSTDETVRAAACEALGFVGDKESVALLLGVAATASGVEQQAARAALVRLQSGDAEDALLRSLGGAEPQRQMEAIRALAGRPSAKAAPKVLELARIDNAEVRREAIRALGVLTRDADLAGLVALVVSPKDAGDRAVAEASADKALRRMTDPAAKAAALLSAVGGAPVEARSSLVRLLGRAACPTALEAVRQALKDGNEGVRDAAVRTLADWPTSEPVGDLLELARTASSETHRVLALRGCVRLAGLSPNADALYVKAMEAATRPEDKKQVLAGLSTATSAEALRLVVGCLKDEPLRAEAARAAGVIADRLRRQEALPARAALRAVIEAGGDAQVLKKAQEILDEMDQYEGYILAWAVAGPFAGNGKTGADLQDMVFPPESPEGKVKWEKLDRGVHEWDVNLADAVGGGDDRVAYVRTRVWSPAAQPVRLELGSDDGIKVWLNGALVHSKYAVRPVSPRSDLVDAKLAEGWNELLLKVVNGGGNWGFCCRVRKPDGSALDGLKVEPPAVP